MKIRPLYDRIVVKRIETQEQMQARTHWGGLLSAKSQARDVEKAASDTQPRAWWQWRWWWPKW